jgi:hypothetical protein
MNIDPINAAGLVLNGSMMICLVLVIVLGRRKLKARKRRRVCDGTMLFSEPRQCLLGFRQLGNPMSKANLERWNAINLPALTKEDRL